MLDGAKKILSKYLKSGEKIAIAVSGGMDSMSLFHLVINYGILKKEDIIVVNIEHGIRGLASKRDSEFVRDEVLKAGVEFLGLSVDVPFLANLSGKSLETEARDERRRVFRELLDKKTVKQVLLAHHKDDQVETILMHIFRGCGLRGLIGMKEEEAGILRPLITSSRAEIAEYAKNNGILYVKDETNDLSEYNRNYLRNELIPKILERWKGADDAIVNLSELANENQSFLESQLNEELIYADELDNSIVKLAFECFSSKPLANVYIRRALSRLGVKSDIEKKHIDKILGLIKLNNGAKIDLSNGIVAAREYDKITFFRPKITKQNGIKEQAGITDQNGIVEHDGIMDQDGITDHDGIMDQDGIEFSVCEGEIRFLHQSIIFKGCEPIVRTGQLRIDADKLPKGTVIRRRRDGDFFKAVNGGTKKLKEFLIDKKIPSRLRDEIPCLCYDKEVLVVVGIEVSDRVKIDSQTKNALRIELKKN